MPVCLKCGDSFPYRMWIEGKYRVLNKRKYCLTCSPFGLGNRAKLHVEGNVLPGVERTITCRRCKKHYTYKRSDRKGHTKTLCASCRVNHRRFDRKVKIIAYLGGACCRCGYNKCMDALHAHHVSPELKVFNIGGAHCMAWKRVVVELDKCILLCANCHAEEHSVKPLT